MEMDAWRWMHGDGCLEMDARHVMRHLEVTICKETRRGRQCASSVWRESVYS